MLTNVSLRMGMRICWILVAGEVGTVVVVAGSGPGSHSNCWLHPDRWQQQNSNRSYAKETCSPNNQCCN